MIRLVNYLWASPTTCLGLLFLPLALLTGGSAKIHTGVLEIQGGAVRWFLAHCTFLRGGAAAMTLGHVVLGRNLDLLNATRRHERIHVRQCERWGLFFLPAYAIASLIALLNGHNPYMDNAFEREAYARTP